MTDAAERAAQFRALHVKGDPLILYNIWDAGSAKAVAKAGAHAVATGSWSMAAAHGFADGEAIPLDLVVPIVERIATTVSLPLTVDFEGGYATEPEEVASNVKRILWAGAIGINFEDRIVEGNGLHAVDVQVARIKALRRAAVDEGRPVFINARTDLFLGADPSTHEARIGEAIERAAAYRDAGADGFFIPGLTDSALIKTVVDGVSLPVNVMQMGEAISVRDAASVGVARFSCGPAPYLAAMSDLAARFGKLNSLET